MAGFIEGKAIDLTPDNDEFGWIAFGDCWPEVKAKLSAHATTSTLYRVVGVTALRLPNGRKRARLARLERRMRAER